MWPRRNCLPPPGEISWAVERCFDEAASSAFISGVNGFRSRVPLGRCETTGRRFSLMHYQRRSVGRRCCRNCWEIARARARRRASFVRTLFHCPACFALRVRIIEVQSFSRPPPPPPPTPVYNLLYLDIYKRLIKRDFSLKYSFFFKNSRYYLLSKIQTTFSRNNRSDFMIRR